MDSITLSGNEFRALASETRVELIKLLQQRNHTLSELSQKTSLAAPTVKQHLSVLETAGLVELFDEGRKWKYYSLTRKGKKILSKEEPKNILIVLAAGIIGVAATLYSFL
ncbi:MAG: winged helix-turn-helix domain-containing protein, partial [Candidatus ainarchaeum sp.]|nr:winged helix-turn-helix domain-containing protein [Candidatus ainarchaeum sp.]